MPATVSVALATCNGERYLPEQLRSIAEQSRPPDELVVSDDRSDDGTLAVVAEFSRSAPFPVRILRNDERLGYGRNFAAALSHCTGRVVFLADQDDVWRDRKIETVLQAFATSPRALAVLHDATITDASLTPTGPTKLGQLAAAGVTQERFATGCCMALRGDLLRLALPLPAAWEAHDQWLAKLAQTLGQKLILEESLLLFRRHDANTSAWFGSGTDRVGRGAAIAHYLKEDPGVACRRRERQLLALQERLRERQQEAATLSELPMAELLSGIQEELEAMRQRAALLDGPYRDRLGGSLKLWFSGGYRHFSGWRSLLRDVLPVGSPRSGRGA